MRSYNVTSDHSHCPWGSQRKLTLSAVSGTGLHIGKVPTRHQPLCNITIDTLTDCQNQYLVPAPDTWWVCGTGLTPCLHTSLFNSTRDFCILVQLVPRVIYHDDSSFIDKFDHHTRYKREPVTLTLAVLLGLGVAAGVGTGVAALVQQPYYYNELRAAMDADLEALAQSITKLEESLTSLSEVVLQNRRGLDLLFLCEKTGILKFEGKWMELEETILSEVTQPQNESMVCSHTYMDFTHRANDYKHIIHSTREGMQQGRF
ncbi:Envelope glycoprotein [Cricetulus griseus]|uniref:Envelope glycoprotein n=1 Tax=Cricetulus griseus TaxID=10029 RepID=G3I796_CRIGR|nr:Envelope glycoprotein [Cricetulus griseus]